LMRVRYPPLIGVFLESTLIREHSNTNQDNNGDAKCREELGFKGEMTHSISDGSARSQRLGAGCLCASSPFKNAEFSLHQKAMAKRVSANRLCRMVNALRTKAGLRFLPAAIAPWTVMSRIEKRRGSRLGGSSAASDSREPGMSRFNCGATCAYRL